uniref:Portal protein n=1 Tax=viral metagenome TaxID=1070528 RepID=A0A6M3J111_9ZZZZ
MFASFYMDIKQEIKTRRQAAEDYLKDKRIVWDNAEQLFHNQNNDAISSETKSQVFDPKLATLAIERSYRVMAQLQTGKVKGISKNDMGDAELKNLLLEKYVIPNANAQWDFLTKMRMMDLYSNIYGNMFSLVDWDVKPNGYIGPDVWILNIRDVFPQVGAVSLDDSDHIIVRTWKPLSYFENLKKDKDYTNVDKIVTKLKDLSGSKQSRNQSIDVSQREGDQYPTSEPAKNSGYFEVLTQFEKDRWVDYCTDADLVFRDRKNPQDDGDLPIKCKHSIPLLDDFMGMSDFERGGSMQKTINSAWNLYLDAVKMSIFPPILINKDNIASMASITQTAAAKWLVRNQITNAASPLQLSPQGIATFNNVYQVATASILNLFGTTETQTTAQTDPTFGRTPQALKMQNQRENTRDNADRYYMESYLSQLMKKFCNLLSKKQPKAITVRMFGDEMEQLSRNYPTATENYDETSGKLTVKKGSDSSLYDYEIVTGSTYAIDQQQQGENMANLLSMFQQAQTPQGNTLVAQLEKDGYKFNFGELFKRLISNSGIQDWDKILTELSQEEQADKVLQADSQQFQQALQQMNGNVNQTPPLPGQGMEGAVQSGPPQGGIPQGNLG